MGLLVLALLALAALCVGCQSEAQPPPDRNRERPEFIVVRVVDGDTVELARAANESHTLTVRVRGIDTPESHSSSKLNRDAERSALDRETIRALGQAATEHAAFLLPPTAGVRIVIDGEDRYGRTIAYIQAVDDFGQTFDFGGRMIRDGFAHAYTGGGRYPHPREDYYRALERSARAQHRGLWADGALAALAPRTASGP